MDTLAIIVTCHAAYLRWLPEALRSIERQLPPGSERALVLDGCPEGAAASAGWRCITGDWGNPALARNAGLAATSAPWLIFWDADNVMAEGYLAAMQQAIAQAPPEVAIVYPDLHFCDEQLTPQQRWTLPEWDYWGLRAENCIDTASAWRRSALDLAGGWPAGLPAFDDYLLALTITAQGWQAQRLHGPPVLMRVHAGSRQNRLQREGDLRAALWQVRSLAVVSLLAGREHTFERWVAFLAAAELPPRTALYLVDNSGRPAFTRMAFAACQELAAARGLIHVDYATVGQPYQPAPAEPYLTAARHRHVARLYAGALPRVAEDLVLTLEDDIEPPLDAVRRLVMALGYRSQDNAGAVAAAYALPSNPAEVCAGFGDERWSATVRWGQLDAAPMEVGFVGGGCTLWANWALRGLPIQLDWSRQLGWDGALCRELRRRGYRVQLHGGVRAAHHVHGREQVAAPPPAPDPPEPPLALPEPPPTDALPLRLTRAWQQALADDAAARAAWHTVEGDGWSWHADGVRANGGADWSALSWELGDPPALRDLGNFVVAVRVSGRAAAAGLSFGPYKDFLTPLDPAAGLRHLQVEVDAASGCWTFRVDGQIMQRAWWDAAVHSVADLLAGQLTLKVHAAEEALFQELTIHTFQSSCRLSVVMSCYRFLQRLRISLRNWCYQELPAGAYEIIVVNPQSPDGAHEHLAAVARCFPNVRVREVAVEPRLVKNKGAMINRAVRASQGDWIWLTDADCLFGPASAAAVLEQIQGREQHLFYGQRRYLTACQTDALLAGRCDGLRDFAALAAPHTPRPPDNAPWGYTQIVHRAVLERIPYREDMNHFAHSDLHFAAECKRHAITPLQLDGLFCLHLDHPFAWYGTGGFL